ncbi:hypothetical protein BS50DRAFT_674886 [Corynespora cassiicola Philippines]|uniref:Uncharacterized protein n=1 Tax=Corynespora cassiicola Philippines TaxID=1448308 RepID=A0A2T2NYN3_CORCC|nr:hypothetical protein BS50DRAFT_674886 [Corynespora cassiicola Philippines]
MDKVDFEEEGRQAVQDQLLSFCVHDQDHAWVVAHKSSRFERHLSRAVKYYRKSQEKLSPNQSFHQEQIERNCRFASLCMAISQNNHKSILRQLQSYATVTEKNLCFGKSIIQVAMDFGDDETLEIVVHHSHRADDKNRTIYLLLSFFTACKSYGKTIGFLTKMIRTLSADRGCEGLTCVLGWINWNFEEEERTTLTEYALSLSIRSSNFEMIETVCGEVDMAAYPLQEAIEIMVHPPQPYETVMRQEASVLELLVRMGANPNMVDENRRGWLLSPLMYAAECERHMMMRVLLRAGADPESDGEQEGVNFWGNYDSQSDFTEKLVMEIKKMSAIEKEKDASRRFLY